MTGAKTKTKTKVKKEKKSPTTLNFILNDNDSDDPVTPGINKENILPTPPPSFGESMTHHVSSLNQAPLHNAPNADTPHDMSTVHWAQNLPPRAVCVSIIDFYFKHVRWNHALVLEGAFRRIEENFWAEVGAEEGSEGAGAASTMKAFIALYYMVLYHGVSNIDPEAEEHANILQSVEEWKKLCQRFWHGAQFAMAQIDLATCRDVELIQALILLALVHLSLEGEAWQAFTPTLAYTVRLAQNMGYATLGAEVEGAVPKDGVQERELKRRLWWTLVSLDWQYLPAEFRMLCPGKFNTAMPSNVDLAEVMDGRVWSVKIEEEATDASLLRARLRIAELAIKQSGHESREGETKSESEYVTALRESKAYVDALGSAPKFLLCKNERLEQKHPYLKAQRLMFTISTSSTIINLHRKFFYAHYHDPAYVEGVAVTNMAAERIMQSLAEIDRESLPASRWWGILFHAYRAGVILLLQYQFRKEANPSRRLSSSRVQSLKTTISLLHQVKNVVSTASKASLVLQHLLEEAQTPTSTANANSNVISHPHKRSRMEIEFGPLLSPTSDTEYNNNASPPAKKQKHSQDLFAVTSRHRDGHDHRHGSFAGLNGSTDPGGGGMSKETWDRILDLEVELDVKLDCE